MSLMNVSAMFFSNYLLSMLVSHCPFSMLRFLVDVVLDAFFDNIFVVSSFVGDDIEVFDVYFPSEFVRCSGMLRVDVSESYLLRLQPVMSGNLSERVPDEKVAAINRSN